MKDSGLIKSIHGREVTYHPIANRPENGFSKRLLADGAIIMLDGKITALTDCKADMHVTFYGDPATEMIVTSS